MRMPTPPINKSWNDMETKRIAGLEDQPLIARRRHNITSNWQASIVFVAKGQRGVIPPLARSLNGLTLGPARS